MGDQLEDININTPSLPKARSSADLPPSAPETVDPAPSKMSEITSKLRQATKKGSKKAAKLSKQGSKTMGEFGKKASARGAHLTKKGSKKAAALTRRGSKKAVLLVRRGKSRVALWAKKTPEESTPESVVETVTSSPPETDPQPTSEENIATSKSQKVRNATCFACRKTRDAGRTTFRATKEFCQAGGKKRAAAKRALVAMKLKKDQRQAEMATKLAIVEWLLFEAMEPHRQDQESQKEIFTAVNRILDKTDPANHREPLRERVLRMGGIQTYLRCLSLYGKDSSELTLLLGEGLLRLSMNDSASRDMHEHGAGRLLVRGLAYHVPVKQTEEEPVGEVTKHLNVEAAVENQVTAAEAAEPEKLPEENPDGQDVVEGEVTGQSEAVAAVPICTAPEEPEEEGGDATEGDEAAVACNINQPEQELQQPEGDEATLAYRNLCHILWRIVFATVSDGTRYVSMWEDAQAAPLLLANLKGYCDPDCEKSGGAALAEDVDLVAWQLAALRLLASKGHEGLLQDLAANDIIALTVKQMLLFKDSAWVAENGFASLAALVENSSKRVELLAQSRPHPWELLIGLAATHSSEQDVLVHALTLFEFILSQKPELDSEFEVIGLLRLCSIGGNADFQPHVQAHARALRDLMVRPSAEEVKERTLQSREWLAKMLLKTEELSAKGQAEEAERKKIPPGMTGKVKFYTRKYTTMAWDSTKRVWYLAGAASPKDATEDEKHHPESEEAPQITVAAM